MKCVICGNGETRSGTATVALERGGATVVIKDVPAEVCGSCGEYYLSEERSAEVMGLAEEVVQEGNRATAPLRRWHAKVAHRRGTKTAMVALARKLLTIAYRLLKDGVDYGAARLRRAAREGEDCPERSRTERGEGNSEAEVGGVTGASQFPVSLHLYRARRGPKRRVGGWGEQDQRSVRP